MKPKNNMLMKNNKQDNFDRREFFIKVKKFLGKIEQICENNNKVAMFIDMDGTINEYTVYSDDKILKQMGDNYCKAEPIVEVIDVLKDISKIPNIDLYILTLSKSNKISYEKDLWLAKYVGFIPKENWIILTKENGDYDSENRDQIKPLKMQEKLKEYNHVILLDDDHRILRQSNILLKDKVDVFHVTSALV